ncbi:MAG: glucuronate isomerase [Victivallales bacterium]|nr:glucuronate isomerase [Victivallales bacterium]
MAFLDAKYLLDSKTAEKIYKAVESLPIIDPHNHCDVKALSEDLNFTDIWDAEAATDHYVWECFRKCGVPEEYLTGKKSNHDKWIAIAAQFPKLAGNPTYEWIHLDLKRRLGIDANISAATAEAIWKESKKLLAKKSFSQQNLIKQMNVETMCSTDDPVDTLEYHKALAGGKLDGVVRPTFRPDKAMNIMKPDFADYIAKLGARWDVKIRTTKDLLKVLRQAHKFFAEMGARASDHGVNIPWGYQVKESDANDVFKKALARKPLTLAEFKTYHSWFLNEVAELDAEDGFVFQLHIGAVRDVRTSLYTKLGADVGGDIGDHETSYVEPLLPLLNRFDGRLKTVLYNMNPVHNATLAQLTRAFGGTVNLGLAWWLNDSYNGMERQLNYSSSVDVMSAFAGMVSDSRKILSYGSRFEVFRRTLAHVLGGMVDRGQVPLDVAIERAVDLSYNRPKTFFGF